TKPGAPSPRSIPGSIRQPKIVPAMKCRQSSLLSRNPCHFMQRDRSPHAALNRRRWSSLSISCQGSVMRSTSPGLRVLDAAAGGCEVPGFALDADEAPALKEGHLARRAAAEERVQHHVSGVAPTYDVVAGKRLGEWRGVARVPSAFHCGHVPHIEALAEISNCFGAIACHPASAAIGLPNIPRQHRSCALVLAILDGVESSARTFAENEHIFKPRGVSGLQCADCAE